MCWNHGPTTGDEREKLRRAIERLEKRNWCEDATIALEAARKHLATLPKPKRWVVSGDGSRTYHDTRGDAEWAAYKRLSYGGTSVSITEADG